MLITTTKYCYSISHFLNPQQQLNPWNGLPLHPKLSASLDGLTRLIIMRSESENASTTSASLFLPPIIVDPTSVHSPITIIFLHGRGQTAESFHAPLLSTQLPFSPDIGDNSPSLREALPQAKFVFPTAQITRATKYRRSLIHQWYDGSGDWEPEALGGMRDSVEYVHALIQKEIHLLGGDASRLVLAGFSQGCAMAETSFLLWEGQPLGAVVGMAGFVPLNAHMTDILEDTGAGDDNSEGGFVFGSSSSSEDGGDEADVPLATTRKQQSPLQDAILALRTEAELPDANSNGPSPSPLSFLKTPVYLGHGTEDPEVPYEHGKRNAELLRKMGIEVDFHTYFGLEHCYSPQMLVDVVSFLKKQGHLGLSTSHADT